MNNTSEPNSETASVSLGEPDVIPMPVFIDHGVKLKLQTPVHEVGHLLGMLVGMFDDLPEDEQFHILKAEDSEKKSWFMRANCTSYEKMEPGPRWLCTLSGITYGAGWAAAALGNFPDENIKDLDPIDLLIKCCKYNHLVVSDDDLGMILINPIKEELRFIIKLFFEAGQELHNTPQLAALVRLLPQLYEDRKVTFDAKTLATFAPGLIRKWYAQSKNPPLFARPYL